MSREIQAVLFDLDNTLYDHDPVFEARARGLVQAHFSVEEEERLTQALLQMLALDGTRKRSRIERFTEIKALYPSLPQEVEEFCYLYIDWLDNMALSADILHLLNSLDGAGIPFGIITNAPVQQHLKLDRLGLNARARCVFISAVFGAHKPDPSIFRAAATALNLPCDKILFVGDSPEADICGAKRVGMKAAWLHRGDSWPIHLTELLPDFHFDSLNQLLPLLGLNLQRE